MSLQPTTDEESFKRYGIPLKDAVKNSDRNSPEKTISDSKNDEGLFFIDLSDYASNDVSAYIYIRIFKYKRGRQTLNLENGGLPDAADRVVGGLTGAVAGVVGGIVKSVAAGISVRNNIPLIGAGVAGGVGGALLTTDRTRDKSDYKGSIRLPLISPVNMNYEVSWGEFINPLNGQSMVNVVAEVANQRVGQGLGSTNPAVNQQAQNRVTSVNEAANIASNDYLQNALANTFGMTFNPENELVLNGIGLRMHTFEFLLTFKNKKEAKHVLDMISVLKRAMTPSKNAVGRTENGSIFLDYPYEFSLFFMDGRDGREGLPLNIPPIPDCALVDMNVTYNPQGQKFHYDSNVTQVRITLTFREHQLLTRDDLEEGGF